MILSVSEQVCKFIHEGGRRTDCMHDSPVPPLHTMTGRPEELEQITLSYL